MKNEPTKAGQQKKRVVVKMVDGSSYNLADYTDAKAAPIGLFINGKMLHCTNATGSDVFVKTDHIVAVCQVWS